MLDPKNVVSLTCGLVADPEVINGKIVKLRVAADYAGQDKTTDNKSGYFDVTFYANDENSNAKFVLSQIEKTNFKKGTQLQILGRLVQERWETDGKKGQRVVIVADAVTYAGGNNPNGVKSGDAPASNDTPASLPTNF